MALTPKQKAAARWAAVVALAIVALLAARGCGDDAPSDGPPGGGGAAGGGGRGGRGGSDTLAVMVALAQRETLEDAIQTTGTLLPDEEVVVRAEIAGRITQLGFDEGARVGRGQTLAVLDTQVLDAQVSAARTQAELARIQAQRQRQLFAIGGLSRAALDQAEAEAAVLQAGVSQLTAEVARRRVVAPFAGQIGLRSVSEGAYVAPGDPIATLRVTSTLKLEFTVPEAYVGRVGPGDVVVFTVPGQERTFRAVVYAVEPGVSQTTRAFTARARTPNPGGLVPGAFAQVELVTARADDAVVVPASAVVPGIDSAAVFVVVRGKAERRAVVLGIRAGDRVQITGGVAPGDTVLTSGVDVVRPGGAVRATLVARPTSGASPVGASGGSASGGASGPTPGRSTPPAPRP
ncbi:MAG TPA: efflux RND transporter periplasmic adaptor subunit [Rubricoccaceae bacterium]